MIDFIFLGMIGYWQVILIVLVLLLLFGGKKIPELLKTVSKAVSEYKKVTNFFK